MANSVVTNSNPNFEAICTGLESMGYEPRAAMLGEKVVGLSLGFPMVANPLGRDDDKFQSLMNEMKAAGFQGDNAVKAKPLVEFLVASGRVY